MLELRIEYQLGALRIKWYLERYHAILISDSTVTRILKEIMLANLIRKPKEEYCIQKDMQKQCLAIM